MNKIVIELENGFLLINGKRYKDLTEAEKVSFDESLIAIRIKMEAEKRQLC